tara:strand:- start:3141 stop:3305 length:165 start_codon:yes stop_codon:yes gene_type:complete
MIYGIRKTSVGIGKKIDSIKEMKYKNELVFFFEQKLRIFWKELFKKNFTLNLYH